MQSAIVSFTWQELQTLPKDTIISLLPLLAQQQAPPPSVDEWATRLFNWVRARNNTRVVDLPGYHPSFIKPDDGHLCTVGDIPLSAFTGFSEWDVPFTVYRALDDGENGDSPMAGWMADMRERRDHQRAWAEDGKAASPAATSAETEFAK